MSEEIKDIPRTSYEMKFISQNSILSYNDAISVEWRCVQCGMRGELKLTFNKFLASRKASNHAIKMCALQKVHDKHAPECDYEHYIRTSPIIYEKHFGDIRQGYETAMLQKHLREKGIIK